MLPLKSFKQSDKSLFSTSHRFIVSFLDKVFIAHNYEEVYLSQYCHRK